MIVEKLKGIGTKKKVIGVFEEFFSKVNFIDHFLRNYNSY